MSKRIALVIVVAILSTSTIQPQTTETQPRFDAADVHASATATNPYTYASGAVSLPDAISKQLGLKLEKRPRPVPIIVIDHMEEKPAEN